MKELEMLLPKNGFYVVISERLIVGDLVFIIGEPVGVIRRKDCYIAKTGEKEGGKANILDKNKNYASKLWKLTSEEIVKLTGGQRITSKAFRSFKTLAAACKLFDNRKRLV